MNCISDKRLVELVHKHKRMAEASLAENRVYAGSDYADTAALLLELAGHRTAMAILERTTR